MKRLKLSFKKKEVYLCLFFLEKLIIIYGKP
jgi:hypothetical protein